MKNKILCLSAAVAFLAFTACKKETVINEATTSIASEETPSYGGKELSLEYDAEIDALIAKMTIEEKSGILHGNSMFTTAGVQRLGIPELKMADGPLGIREELQRDSWAPKGLDNDFATFYPAGGGLSATWNTELAHTFGKSIGEEARARDKDVLLAPAFNIIRTPLGGRTFEYFTEDPFLDKKLVVPYVVGVQENDVAACIKHYAANNQETNRGSVDVLMDERTLREIYLPAFEAAVTEGKAYSVMGAYNKFRGDYLCENAYMLNGILKGEWGFNGIVISDWDAVHSTAKTLQNGMDVEMGTIAPFDKFWLATPLIEAVKSGKISEAEVDKHVKRVLRIMYNIKSIDNKGRAKGSINTEAHFQDAYNIASESVVLLKNTENLLPIQPDKLKSVAVIGANSVKTHAQGGFGAGVKTRREITPLQALQTKLPKSVTINYAKGYQEQYVPSANKGQNYGRLTIDRADPKMIAEAVAAAKKSDIAIIFAGSNRDYESEASDRKSLQLPFGQEELIAKVKAANPRTIVVMIAGAPFDLNKTEKLTSALVWSWYNGSEGGNALADILMGKVNPSGKLPWTMPKDIKDSPAHATNSFPGGASVTYAEGILVGYRWFDTKNITPMYPFGYGLSYTTFTFENTKTDKKAYAANETITVTLNLKNTGKVDGKEVVQLYVAKAGSKVARAAKELKGFKKLSVKAGNSATVTIKVPVKELAYYDVAAKKWIVEPGTYTLKIGNSSQNILSETVIEIK